VRQTNCHDLARPSAISQGEGTISARSRPRRTESAAVPNGGQPSGPERTHNRRLADRSELPKEQLHGVGRRLPGRAAMMDQTRSPAPSQMESAKHCPAVKNHRAGSSEPTMIRTWLITPSTFPEENRSMCLLEITGLRGQRHCRPRRPGLFRPPFRSELQNPFWTVTLCNETLHYRTPICL
jgi:hypothetical protein